MKKENRYPPKKSKLKNKRTGSSENIVNEKKNNYNRLSNKLEDRNTNITHINNINIVNMIMNKEKFYKSNNISNNNANNRSQSDKKDNNEKTYEQKRNNTSFLIDYNAKGNFSTLSNEDLKKLKINKFLLNSPVDNPKISQIMKYKKKAGLLKTKQKNNSYKKLSNINISLYNNKYLNKKSKHKRNNISSGNLNTLSPNKQRDLFKKLRNKINNEESEENIKNKSKNINRKKYINKSTDDGNYMKDLIERFNLNKETENKEYIESEMNFNNKLENDDYGKDLEYLNFHIPYTIKVNLNKKINESNIKNTSPKYLNTNNESIFNLNKSLNKNEFNNILLIKDNNIKLEIPKTYPKYINGNKKKYYFDNDDEIINFVKNKFKEKNSKYLSELQSKNYITNIFGNSNNNNNNYKKKKNAYTGFILSKKIKGQNNFEIELNNINLDNINRILNNEKFEINNEFVIFTPMRNINILKEENKNIKWEYNKLKEENKNINLNVIKLKEDNTLLKIKYGKLKHECDNLMQELKIENYKIKEFIEKINKKDIIIKKYEKKLNENQIEIRKLENKILLYKSNKNNFIIINQIQIELKDKELKIYQNNFINKDNDNPSILMESKININHALSNIRAFRNNLKIDKVQVFNYESIYKNKYNKISWINDKNIKIEKCFNINYNINANKQENIFINKKKEIINNNIQREKIFNIYYEGIKNIRNINKNLIIEKLNDINIILKNNNNKIIINNDNIDNIALKEDKIENKDLKKNNLIIEKLNQFNYKNDKKRNNINKNLIIELISNINYDGNKRFINNIEKLNNFHFQIISHKNKKLFDNLISSKSFEFAYHEILNNKNIKLILEKNIYFNYEGIKYTNNIIKNYNISMNNNFSFEALKKHNKAIVLEHINNIYYEGNKSKNIILNITKENNSYFEHIKKNVNLIIEKKDIIYYENILLNKNKINRFINNSIEKINDITYVTSNKLNKNTLYEIEQNTLFTLINTKIDKIKKFNNLEIYKDIKNYFFFEKIVPNLEKEKDKEEKSLYEDIYETPKDSINNKPINNISTINNISNINSLNNISSLSKIVEKSEKNNSQQNQKNARASRALNRIKKRNKTKDEKDKVENNLISSDILMALQNVGSKGSKGEIKYRQSFRIMEIAKKLEKEIKKEGEDENKIEEKKGEENNNNIDAKYRNSCAIEIISHKPVDNKKKKKNRISFVG